MFATAAWAAQATDHGLNGLAHIVVPNSFTSDALAYTPAYIGEQSDRLADDVLTTLISNGRGYASISKKSSGEPLCTSWLERTDAEGFAVFGLPDAKKAPKNGDICHPFRLQRFQNGDVELRWGPRRGVGRILSVSGLTPIDWSKLPTLKMRANEVALGVESLRQDQRLSRGKGMPVFYPGDCKQCPVTLNRYLLELSKPNTGPRTDGTQIVGASMLGGYSGSATLAFSHRVMYQKTYLSLRELQKRVYGRFAEPSLTLPIGGATHQPELPGNLIWVFGSDGQQLSERQTVEQCLPAGQPAATLVRYRAKSDLQAWACGMVFSVGIKYRNTTTAEPWIQEVLYDAHAPHGLAHHQFTDRMRRVLAARQRLLAIQEYQPQR